MSYPIVYAATTAIPITMAMTIKVIFSHFSSIFLRAMALMLLCLRIEAESLS